MTHTPWQLVVVLVVLAVVTLFRGWNARAEEAERPDFEDPLDNPYRW